MPFGGKELGLGVVNPRTDAVESSAAIRAAVEDALRLYAPGRIFLNPDCGFSTFQVGRRTRARPRQRTLVRW
jgi:5-methyltetrahydropteroyltriglutamate--homocysteine methyltransferase